MTDFSSNLQSDTFPDVLVLESFNYSIFAYCRDRRRYEISYQGTGIKGL